MISVLGALTKWLENVSIKSEFKFSVCAYSASVQSAQPRVLNSLLQRRSDGSKLLKR